MVAASRIRTVYSLRDATPARTIWVYRNGDPFFLGRKFVISHRYVPTFEAFMIQLNEGVPTPFGVRNVYTPREGHSVKDLTDLNSGGKYVAAGREKFRKLDYFGIGAKKPQRKKKDELIRPVVHSNIQVPSKWQSFYNKPYIINVFTNGDALIAPVKILIPRFILTNWDHVLGVVNEKVLLRSGGIRRLYTLHGQLVHGSGDLEDNQFYVACSKEKFQPLPYWQHPKVPGNIRRNFDDRTPEEPPKPPKRKGLDTHASRSRASPRLLPVQSRKEQPKRGKGDRQSVFYARSKKASPERAPKELSSDDGHSVFKAVKSQNEIEEAQEIQEDKDVKVDLPVDQVPAETVQEEDIYASTEYLVEKTKEDDQYEELNNQAKKSIFKKMLGILHRPSKKKDGETKSQTRSARVSNAGKEDEGDGQRKDSASKQQLQPVQVTGNEESISQDDMKEEKKEQQKTKQRQRLFIKQREFFDENDYY